MKPSQRLLLALTITSLAAVVGAGAQSVTVPLSPDRWIIGEKNERVAPGQDLSTNGKVVDHLGQPSLHLAKGFAHIRDLDLQNGTLDADMAFDPKGSFIGLAFRVQSEDSYELFFFRKGASGSDQAIQYTPGFLGRQRMADLQRPALCRRGRVPF